ncbi:HK97 family phage prohead protease [Roseicella aerolata]|uniref:HK97 family phage prohead protease n=1 Tax=Roseicella aerolata TaxID=2883479 RepID=A0A9X1LAP4_9PROT|nr:HK97 family phage prohead protease [Roseicella aerolata]MCB4825221.1 HK97 family phage prohead protease [Roseicella aerolata]
MTDPIDLGGVSPAPEAAALPDRDLPSGGNVGSDRMPSGGQSVVAQRALAAPATVDRAARTVEVVWSTGARARNFVPPLGPILEELDMAPAAVRMDGLRSGRAPVLDAHRRGGARDVLGRVVAARIEAGRGYATLQFSSAADVEPVWQRVADGTLRAVSVGYRVHRYEPVPDAATGQTVHRAVDWEPFEISVVPVPIDPAAAVRGEAEQGSPATALEPPLPEDPSMSETTPATPAAEPAPTVPPVSATPTAAPEPTRAAVPASDLEAVRAEAERAAIERLAGYDTVLAGARGLLAEDLLTSLRQAAIRDRIAPEVLRGRLWEAFTAGTPRPSIPARPETGPANDDPAVLIDAMAEALAARSMPGYQPQGSGRHAEFLGWRPSDMVGELLRARGERNVPRNPTLLAERAFHTTSDFPLLLSAAANKMLLAAYAPAAPSYRQIFLRRDFRDFKPHRHLRVGDFPTLLPLLENGEIQAGTMSESQEIVLLQTFARRIRVTRPMLVNDDLGAFTDFAAMIGRRVADFENATAVDCH